MKLTQETLPATLFPIPPVIRFAPETTQCCGERLYVQKTCHKKVFTMTGTFIAHETIYQCRSCSGIYKSEALHKMVPKWCNAGYDVLVYVGRALFKRYRTIQEVQTELSSRNVMISESEISSGV